jgi:Immunity protein 50
METQCKHVIGREKIVAAFGKWPTFHDSEVVSIFLERDAGKENTPAQMFVKLHAFRIEVGPDDPERNNSLVTFLFKGLEQLKLMDFNHQNAINGIAIDTLTSEELQRQVFKVTFQQGFGLYCEFHCDEIEVQSIEPYRPQWGAWKA